MSAQTKKRTFAIPQDFLASFFQELEEGELDFELTEVDEDGDLIVKVTYDTSQREQIMNLIELEDEYNDDDEDEED